jgi:hypothetical protein
LSRRTGCNIETVRYSEQELVKAKLTVQIYQILRVRHHPHGARMPEWPRFMPRKYSENQARAQSKPDRQPE